ncbi:MAG: glycosyl transferase 4 family protein [Bacillales bacterium]|jgi:UDP-GlcNAc:undecaprenyl-phosphate GlcNAc-1-phosphate transferase|nr:glycosyl transferase 4 family protein [Bacillales bacterium]
MNPNLALTFLAPFITALLITPLVIKFAVKIGAVDKPDHRKVHQKVMPRLGGLAIFLGLVVGFFVSGMYTEQVTGIVAGVILIVAVGFADDIYQLSAKWKLLGQLIAAGLVVGSGLMINVISIPFMGAYDLGFLAYPVTVLWIVGITNAINLIDGLDGLSAGVSSIVIGTIAVLAFVAAKILILTIALIALGATLGFLFHNFHPAKIFMGDVGSLLLGFIIAIISLLGLFKSVTLFSFIVPIIILGVPIFDTLFAVIRRVVNKQPISAPDKSHLHHRLLAIGFSHKGAVLLIYSFSLLFSISAIIFSSSTLLGSIVIIIALVVVIEVLAEIIGLVHDEYKPFTSMFRKVLGREEN